MVFALVSKLLNCRRFWLVNCRYVKSWLKELAVSGVDATGRSAPIGENGDSMAFGGVLHSSGFFVSVVAQYILWIKMIMVVVVVGWRKHYQGRRPRSNLGGWEPRMNPVDGTRCDVTRQRKNNVLICPIPLNLDSPYATNIMNISAATLVNTNKNLLKTLALKTNMFPTIPPCADFPR